MAKLNMYLTMIIGRKREIEELEERYQSDKPEFVAIYGRRRVGKTFLVKELFQDKMAFYHSGLSPYDKERKIRNVGRFVGREERWSSSTDIH